MSGTSAPHQSECRQFGQPMEQVVVGHAKTSKQICLLGPALMHVRQLADGCDQITGKGHSLILRAQDPLVVMEDVAEVRKATLPHRPKPTAHRDCALGEQVWIDAWFYEAALEEHEQDRVADVVETRIHQYAF